MAIKKKAKKKFVAKKVASKLRFNEPQSNEGFFQRMKEIIKSEMPQPERVRVKTFIVEKPVIIHDKAQKYDSDEDLSYDSKKSRYSRNSLATGMGLVKSKKKINEEDEVDQTLESDDFSEASTDSEILDADATDEFSEKIGNEDSSLVDEGSVGDEVEDLEESAPISAKALTHPRSRGMFDNIWWKKALFWSILVWLFILAVSMAMQALKLIIVDLTRQWWMLLGIIIVIEMIYFKFFDGKLNI